MRQFAINICLFLVVWATTTAQATTTKLHKHSLKASPTVEVSEDSHTKLSDLSLPLVCTPSFNMQLQSMFILQDRLSAARDSTVLCQLCSSIVRLGVVFRNDERTQDSWSKVLAQNSCKYSDRFKQADCEDLSEHLLDKLSDAFFETESATLSEKDLQLSSSQLGQVIHSRSLDVCAAVNCCPPNSQGKVESLIVSEAEQKCDADSLEQMDLERKDIKEQLNILRGMSDALSRQEDELFRKKGELKVWQGKLNRQHRKLSKWSRVLESKEKVLEERGTTLEGKLGEYRRKMKQLKGQKRSLNQRKRDLDEREEQLDQREASLAEGVDSVDTE